MQPLSKNSGIWLNIFPDYSFECDGTIGGWEFYAYQAGTVRVGIWRPTSDGYELVGANIYYADAEGTYVCWSIFTLSLNNIFISLIIYLSLNKVLQ